MRLFSGLFFLAAGLLTSTAFAQTAAERAACESDYKQYCSSVIPGGGRPMVCLSGHLDDLTPECKKVVQSHIAK
jgi:hypothetical protein